ncbi:hypothetical protein CEXT_748611 [Caerostris extrusa]|uniref:Uncharacterized protein n=1 Tax=Caerostris extrusa TaxID=172846 RepID=A0AAV4Y5L7_CAEEX|nr:hypothetical protein CEXT_748611 [Caerostris extrusa]
MTKNVIHSFNIFKTIANISQFFAISTQSTAKTFPEKLIKANFTLRYPQKRSNERLGFNLEFKEGGVKKFYAAGCRAITLLKGEFLKNQLTLRGTEVSLFAEMSGICVWWAVFVKKKV